jgi:hypothetical protein
VVPENVDLAHKKGPTFLPTQGSKEVDLRKREPAAKRSRIEGMFAGTLEGSLPPASFLELRSEGRVGSENRDRV